MIKLSAQAEEKVVRFTVFNEGDGIEPEKLDSLFQKFTRLEDDLAARKKRGTGLVCLLRNILSTPIAAKSMSKVNRRMD
jgi:K+-sensing histidine kinase KdpD